MTLPVIIHPDVISFFNNSSQTDFGNRVWKCIDKLKKRQFDGGLRVKKLQGTTKRVWEARVTQAVRLIFTYTKSIQADTGEPQVYLTIQDLCLDHDDVSRQVKARQRTPDHQWLDAEELETVGSLETERTSLTPDEQSAIDQAEAEELQISEEVVDELVGNIQWRVVESESEWQQAITNQDVDLPLKLTPEEYELVNHYGNLLLSGNAGTGKTTVGLYRLLKSLENLPEGKRLYVAYNPVLVKEAKQKFNRLVGAKISEVESLFEFKTIRELCLDILEEAGETYFEANEVTYQAFDHLYRRAERNQYPSALVWDEIRSIIKGSYLETDQNLLSKNQYKQLGKKRSSTISTDQRPKIYELAEWYQKQLDTDERFDEIDLARQVLKLIKQGTGNRYEMIICDEVQDLTELQLHLLLQLITPNGHLFFAGDLNQIVSSSGFRWKELKSKLYRNKRPVKQETLYFNFRSVGSLTQLANQVLKLKSRLLNETVEQSNQAVNSYGEWARLINASSSELQPTLEQLNPEDAILVRTEANKDEISDKFQSSFVFTIEEAKGLEFDTVFLVEFFQVNSNLWQKVLEGKGTLKDKEKPALRRELNLLYVAITRTRRILNIWETQLSSLWTQEEVDSFTEQIEPESVREVRIEPTAEMWKERGLYYLEAKFYRQAIECFKFSGDFQLQRQSEAKLFLQEGKESEAIEIFVELGNHEKVAQLFEKQKQWEKAAEQYNLAGLEEKVTECREKNQQKHNLNNNTNKKSYFKRKRKSKIINKSKIDTKEQQSAIYIDTIFLNQALFYTGQVYQKLHPNLFSKNEWSKKLNVMNISELVPFLIEYISPEHPNYKWPGLSSDKRIDVFAFKCSEVWGQITVDPDQFSVNDKECRIQLFEVDLVAPSIQSHIVKNIQQYKGICIVGNDLLYDIMIKQGIEKGFSFSRYKSHHMEDKITAQVPFQYIAYPIGRSWGLQSYEL
ncbi:AAA family ATPase (plasmid) [Euhalothece natronophila Z-M001]|uniref:AAA family ATPase n=1 Tax=Euhalothece natronophila Z-M001 TaxID=522448 RepID=A0A5B8NRG5_9CHRO|nr:UvrD-helicase domain-containing protein [Euhalothece natronophila]QDZ41587.1 AAA family ATPase [Euhalothece natronophila Z-M001]